MKTKTKKTKKKAAPKKQKATTVTQTTSNVGSVWSATATYTVNKEAMKPLAASNFFASPEEEREFEERLRKVSGRPYPEDMNREQLLEEVERLNDELSRRHVEYSEAVKMGLANGDVARHNFEMADLVMHGACGWAFDIGRLGVACYWCHGNLGNDPEAIRQHTATCDKRPPPAAVEALKALLAFEPVEVVKDAFAYDRLLQTVKDAARKGLGLEVTLAG